MKTCKKISTVILCAVICAIAVLCFTGCKDKPEDKGYIVLSFELNCNGLAIEPIILDGKTPKEMPKDPIRAGYTFGGWYFDNDTFTAKFDPQNDALTSDTTLYAKWNKNNIQDPDKPIIEDQKGIIYEEEAVNGAVFYTVKGYEGKETEIIVPSRYNTRPVTKIADRAFAGNTSITKVSFGLNIEWVGQEAFRGCTSLKNITVAEGSYYYVSKDGLLYNRQLTTLIAAPAASGVKSVDFGKELTDIYDYALENCRFDVSFARNSGYKDIEGCDFAGFAGSVEIGKSVEEIRQYAFKDATCKITFSADCALDKIGVGAFDSYKGEKIVIPGTVKDIFGHAFNECTAEVDLSRTGITEISANAFARYRGKTLVVPISVTKIGKHAFYQSTADITFASGSAYSVVTEESFAMFYGTVTFPFTVSGVEKNAFWESRAKIIFDCAEGELNLTAGYDNGFKGSFVYLKN